MNLFCVNINNKTLITLYINYWNEENKVFFNPPDKKPQLSIHA
jgi:hypothetical protein